MQTSWIYWIHHVESNCILVRQYVFYLDNNNPWQKLISNNLINNILFCPHFDRKKWISFVFFRENFFFVTIFFRYKDAVWNLKKIPESHYAVLFDRCRVENIEDVECRRKRFIYFFPCRFLLAILMYQRYSRCKSLSLCLKDLELHLSFS